MKCVENRVSLATTEAIPLVTPGATKHALLLYQSKKESRDVHHQFSSMNVEGVPRWLFSMVQGLLQAATGLSLWVETYSQRPLWALASECHWDVVDTDG